MRSTELGEICLETHNAGVGVGIVLDVIVLHVLAGFVQVARAEDDAEKVISQLLVGGQLGIVALEQRGLVGGGSNRERGENGRSEQSERKGAMESSHVERFYRNGKGD